MNKITFNCGSLPGFSTILTLVFITLKLCNIITWSWLWVLSPLWISVLLVIVLVPLLFFVLYLVYSSER